VCRDYIDDYILVSEAEIKSAMLMLLEKHHKLVEGAAGVAVAALLKEKGRFKGRKVAVVICGGNVGRATVKKILEE
jgi:threonine dehydratase